MATHSWEYESSEHGNYEVHISDTRQEMRQIIVQVEPEGKSIPDDLMGYCNISGDSCLPFVLINVQDMIGDQGCVEHECSHLAFSMMRRKHGISETGMLTISLDGEDEFCYLVTKLADSVWEAFGEIIDET